MSADTALVPHVQASIAVGPRGVQIHTIDDLWRLAKVAHASGLMPKGIHSPEAAFMIIQAGLELSLSPWQALQGMQSINGKVGIGGDLALAIVRNSGLMESYREHYEGTGDLLEHVITTRRKGEAEEYVSTFGVADARMANLWGKPGPWSQYGRRMLRYRNLGFHLRDYYPEPLKGFKTSEELADYPVREERNVTPFPVEVPQETPGDVAARKIAEIQAERASTPEPEPEAIDAEEVADDEPSEGPQPFAREERREGETITNKALVKLAGICYGRRVQIEDVARQVFGCSSTSLTMPEATRLAELVRERAETRIQPDVARELEELCKQRGLPLYQTLADYGVERAEDLDPETAAQMRTDLLN